jgi:hypothetical protein
MGAVLLRGGRSEPSVSLGLLGVVVCPVVAGAIKDHEVAQLVLAAATLRQEVVSVRSWSTAALAGASVADPHDLLERLPGFALGPGAAGGAQRARSSRQGCPAFEALAALEGGSLHRSSSRSASLRQESQTLPAAVWNISPVVAPQEKQTRGFGVSALDVGRLEPGAV